MENADYERGFRDGQEDKAVRLGETIKALELERNMVRAELNEVRTIGETLRDLVGDLRSENRQLRAHLQKALALAKIRGL